MEMWCPDDTGRDSWDWVGPPAWERACFNSPEWGGGSSPVKTEPPQIVLLLLLLLTRPSERECMSTTPENELCTTGGPTPESELPASAPTPSPRTLTPVSARGLQKIDSRKISKRENAENTEARRNNVQISKYSR